MFFLYMSSVISGDRRGAVAVFIRGILIILSWLYAAVVTAIDVFYTLGLRRARSVSVPVVSVGNLTLGGTGKTPAVVHIALYFKSIGKKPAVLTRGYGNDESRMLSEQLPDVPVYTGQNRYKSALKAVISDSDVLILDDGFQHRTLKRDLDILLVDGRVLFGNGRIFPAGVLRESLAAARRADIVMLTKANNLTASEMDRIKERLAELTRSKPVVISEHAPVSFRTAEGVFLPLGRVKGSKICVVSGIADPFYFESSLRSLGADPAKRYFYPDHHSYTQEDLDGIASACFDPEISAIVTTAKDFVKMKDLDISRLARKVLVLEIRIDIIEGKEKLIAGLDSVFSRDRS